MSGANQSSLQTSKPKQDTLPSPAPSFVSCKADGKDTSHFSTRRDIPTPEDALAIPNIGEGQGQVQPMQQKPIMPNVKATNNGCFDTITFDIPARDLDGKNKVWYDGQYVKEVRNGASDQPVQGLKGNEHIQLVIWAPTLKNTAGFPLYEDGAYDIEYKAGLGSLRELKMISDFEGHTTFAISTDYSVPFEIEYGLSKGQTLEVVVMLAHTE